MARTVQIILDVDDRGSAKIRGFSQTVKSESKKAAAAAENSFRQMGARVGASIDKLTTRFLRYGQIIGAVFGAIAIRQVLKFGSDFQASMSGVRAVSNEVGASFEQLTQQARDLGATTAFTAIEAAAAMEELGKAGFDAFEILRVMPDVLNLAGAGLLDMAEAASITSNIIRSMGISIFDFTEATDILAATSISAKTTISDLGFAFQDSAPVARGLGADILELSSSLGILANRGFVATRAGTALRRIYSVFLGDMEEGEKGLGKFNITVKDGSGAFVGMANIIEQFNEQGVTANEIMEAFGLRGGPAMLAIFRAGSEEIQRFGRMLEESGGTAADVFAERFNNLKGKTKEFTSALQELQLVFFDKILPALTAGAEQATEFVRAWAKAVQASDIMRGIGRAATALVFALKALAVVITIGLVRKFAAFISQALIPLIAGFDAAAVAVFRFDGALVAFRAASAGHILAFAGIAAGVFAIAWQIGRTIGEVTGLDAVLTEFFAKKFDFGEHLKAEDALRDQTVDQLTRSLNALRKAGAQIVISPDMVGIFEAQDALDAFDQGIESTRRLAAVPIKHEFAFVAIDRELASIKDKLLDAFDEDAIAEINKELSGFLRIIRALNAEDLDEFQKQMSAMGITGSASMTSLRGAAGLFGDALKKAGSDGATGVEQFRAALDIYRSSQAEADKTLALTAQAAATRAQELKKALESLGKAAGQVGLSTTLAGKAFSEDFNKQLELTIEKGIEAEFVYRVYGATIDKIMRGFVKSGDTIPPELEKINAALRESRTAVENFNAVSKIKVQGSGEIFSAITQISIEYFRLLDAFENGLTIGVRDEKLRELEARLVKLANQAPEFREALASILPGFDPSLRFTKDALQVEASLLLMKRAAADLAGAIAAGAEFQFGAFDDNVLEAQIAALERRTELELFIAEKKFADLRELSKTNDTALKQLAQAHSDTIDAIERKGALGRLKLHEQVERAKVRMGLTAADQLIGALGTIWGGSKALAIAQIIVSTAQAVMKTYDTYGNTPWGIALAVAMAGIGAVQLAKVRSTEPNLGAQFGGLITGRRTIEVGEAGAEAIIPLRGPAAAQARRALGFGDVPAGGGFGVGSSGMTINVPIQIRGDNWTDTGISEGLAVTIHEAVQDGIDTGVLALFRTDARRSVPQR